MYYQPVHLHPPPHEVEMHTVEIHDAEDPPQPKPQAPPSTLQMLGISVFGIGYTFGKPRAAPADSSHA